MRVLAAALSQLEKLFFPTFSILLFTLLPRRLISLSLFIVVFLDGMLQTLHLMQQQQQQQQTASGYDSTLRPLLQNFSAAGFATLGSNGAPPSMFQVPPPPPPPPDQPLPPLPPITPSSGTSGTQQHHQRPSSTINPYAASSAVSIFANGGNGTTMITSTHTGKFLYFSIFNVLGIGINQVARIGK